MLKTFSLPRVVTIAGSDSSGGAGIQADIKTISATGCYAASIITILTAQNTQGVQAIQEIPIPFIQQQIDSVFNDLHPQAVKIGMLYNEAIIQLIADNLQKYQPPYIVLDPVMVSQSGYLLLKPQATQALVKNLFPAATLITPNIPEAETLLNTKINNLADMECAVKTLANQSQVSVLMKGGHLESKQSPDVFYDYPSHQLYRFDARRIDSNNTHGTGCTLSSAIASYLAQGETLHKAIDKAKTYLINAIESGKNLLIGQGNGPVNHFYFLK